MGWCCMSVSDSISDSGSLSLSLSRVVVLAVALVGVFMVTVVVLMTVFGMAILVMSGFCLCRRRLHWGLCRWILSVVALDIVMMFLQIAKIFLICLFNGSVEE